MPGGPLDRPIQFIRGVGPVRAAQFEALGVRTAGDLLEHIPFRYELCPKSKPIGHLQLDESATVVGAIHRLRSGGGWGRSPVTAEVVDGTGRCRVRWFNSAYLRDRLEVGQVIRLSGKVAADDRRAVFVNPSYRIIPDGTDPLADDSDSYMPVYSTAADLSSKYIGRTVRCVLDELGEAIADFLPSELRSGRNLPSRRSAVARIHRPTSPEDVGVARRRLAYDELLLMQLALQMRRQRSRAAGNAPIIRTTEFIDKRIRARLPFKLTAAQKRAAREIADDLSSACPMTRLLQGDVGAGKTAVAVYAALTTVANHFQVAILSPTEILAQQTHDRIRRYLEGSRVRVDLLIGGMGPAARRAVCARLGGGETDLVVGTHALIEKDVRFHTLGLVIVDEQHRFGVIQRQQIRSKGSCPHYLVMTATPIPRTLAMTVYGDLEVTVIDELPPGRRTVETRLVGPAEVEGAWRFVRDRLAAGEQAYVVYPLVEESDSLVGLKAATAQFDKLRHGRLQGLELGLVHGRMTAEQKEKVVSAFRAGTSRALVTTTVIEVGVDVPSATVMVVEHADRYGLSQLHQLRGRIGRGDRPSYCLLMSEFESDKARLRLEVLRSTTDGFRIAEEDLKIRGPGELIGTRQHGLPVFKAADLINDLDLLRQARDDAADLLRGDATLSHAGHQALGEEVARKYPSFTTEQARNA